jgi:uncharacterized membrane protein YgdD (TMEM256/DUF423 family)
MSTKTIIIISGIFGFLAVAIGALGAHALKPLLSDFQLQSFETGVKYHFYHTLLLLILGFWKSENMSKQIKWACYLLIAGIVLFSGSIYILNTAHLFTENGLRFLGPVTPVGGLMFMIAWILIGFYSFNKN